MIFGIDLGNEETKTSNMVKFHSRIFNGHKEMNKGEIKVDYKGKKYTVGSKEGTPVLGINRIYSTMYDICLLTAIAKSCIDPVVEADIVVSLPPDLYESELKDKLKEKLINMGQQEITIDGTKRHIRIKNAAVFCENSIVFNNPQKYKPQRTITIDVGGGTADISEFLGLKLVNHTSTQLGMLSLYQDMKKAVNAKYTTKLTADDMEDIIGKDIYEIRQEMRDVSFTKDIIHEHVTKICNVVNQYFNYDNAKIELLGGGASVLGEYFAKEYPNIQIVEDAQFANAKTNEAVGEMLWNVG